MLWFCSEHVICIKGYRFNPWHHQAKESPPIARREECLYTAGTTSEIVHSHRAILGSDSNMKAH